MASASQFRCRAEGRCARGEPDGCEVRIDRIVVSRPRPHAASGVRAGPVDSGRSYRDLHVDEPERCFHIVRDLRDDTMAPRQVIPAPPGKRS